MKIHYNHGVIESSEIINYLSLSGRVSPLFHEIVSFKEAREAAKDLGILVSNEQLQICADQVRIRLGLFSAQRTSDFFEQMGLQIEEFEEYCESVLFISLVKEKLFPERKIDEFFFNNRSDFDQARISMIEVKEENEAREIILRVKEDGEDFHVIARKQSLDLATKFSGGYVGLVSPQMRPSEFSKKVFTANAGDIVGPINQDKKVRILLVEEVIKSELNECTRNEIREKLFDDWVQQFSKEGFKIK